MQKVCRLTPFRKHDLVTPLEQSVLELQLCSMDTADNGYYNVEATAALADHHCADAKPSGFSHDAAISSLEQLDTPCFLVRLPIVARNCSRMAERASVAGVSLRPHVKTSVFYFARRCFSAVDR